MIMRLKLSGEAKKFVKDLIKKTGWSERTIIAKALMLLEKAEEGRLLEIDKDGRVVGKLKLTL